MKRIASKRTRKIPSPPRKPGLPRSLHSLHPTRSSKLVVVFQGGSTLERMRVANLLAGQLAQKVYRVDLRMFISRFIGETEKNLNRIFESADSAETLLFFDEADALFGKHPPLPTGCDRSAQWWIPHLNKCVEGFHGTILFATNQPGRATQLAPKLKPVITRLS